MALEGLYVRLDAPQLADLRSEILSLTAGRHANQVHVLGLVCQCSTGSCRPSRGRRSHGGWKKG